MAWLYTILQHLFLILFFPVLILIALTKKRYRTGLLERFGRGRGQPSGPAIWMHAASLGEVKVSAPVCLELMARFPGYAMVFSTSTIVGKKQAKVLAKGVKDAFLLPLDFPWCVCPVVSRVRPEFFLAAETELWPNLFFCLRRKGSRIALFNGRISDRSFRRYLFFRFFFRAVLSKVDLFCMQTDMDAKRIKALGADETSVVITGNVKFDAPYQAMSEAKRRVLRDQLRCGENAPVWVAGSVHPGEMPQLIQAFKALSESFPSMKWIVVPRHLYDLDKFKEALKAAGLSWGLWKGAEKVAESGNILIVDALGQLERLYQIAFAAFIGGSLIPVGGHNPLESLRYGIPTFFGPHMRNFREIHDIVTSAGVGLEIMDGEELANRLEDLLVHPQKRQEIMEKSAEMFRKYQGATDRSLEYLTPWINGGKVKG